MSCSDIACTARISEKLLLLEELLDISSPVDSDDEGTSDRPEGGAPGDDDEDEDNDDGFDNFSLIKKHNHEATSVENCAKLERATLLFLGLDLAFVEGIDIPAVQVRDTIR